MFSILYINFEGIVQLNVLCQIDKPNKHMTHGDREIKKQENAMDGLQLDLDIEYHIVRSTVAY